MSNHYTYKPRTKFQTLVKDLGINEAFTIKHRKQKVFNKFINNVPLYENYNIMVDLLQLPKTSVEGFKYLLTAVDLGSNRVDFEPVKTKTAEACLSALKAIFKRPYIKEPMFSISSDGGTEFKSDFDRFCIERKIYHKVSMPYRHSQQAPVESLNKSLSRILLGYLNDIELKTGKKATDWTPMLSKMRTELNKYRERKNLDELRNNQSFFDVDKAGEPEYKVGDFVHYLLNRPYDALNNPLNDASFRKGDMRYSPTVHTIENILMMNDEPYYRYTLSGLPSVSFSAEQLMLTREQEEKTYLVKKLLDKTVKKNKIHFLVWWKGYLKKDATWEPQSNLIKDGLKNMIDEFNRSGK